MPSPARRLALAVGLLLLLAACASPTGSLQITVTGLPAGENASVNVAGPGSYGAAVTATTTLAGLTPGTYSVIAGTVTTTAVTTEYEATITPGTISVVAGETANVSVAYDPAGGTLAVAVSGLPAGVDADVNVTGPDAFDQDLTTSTVLTDLTPGEYSATASPVTDGSNDYSATVSGSLAEVSSSTGAGIEVAYELDAGSLQVTLTGLPGGLDPDVLVEGANGFSQIVTDGTTLNDLAPGIYTLTADDVRTDDPIVSEVYEASPSFIEVTSNATSDGSVPFAVRAGSGHLWIPAAISSLIVGFDAIHLATSTDPTPEVTVATPGLSPDGLALAGDGALWATGSTDEKLYKFEASALANDATPPPSVTISGLGDQAIAAAFDAAGNLWVGLSNSSILRFTPAQLSVDGSPVAASTITGTGVPTGLAFDQSGNLWVASFDSTLKMYTPQQLDAGGALTPEVTITANAGSLSVPEGLAFDSSGNLWVANAFASTLVRFSPSQLSESGNPVPDATVTDNAGSLDSPSGLALDNSGDLWVTNFIANTLVQFDNPASFVGTVSPAPLTTIALPDLNFGFHAFNPTPEGLPLQSP